VILPGPLRGMYNRRPATSANAVSNVPSPPTFTTLDTLYGPSAMPLCGSPPTREIRPAAPHSRQDFLIPTLRAYSTSLRPPEELKHFDCEMFRSNLGTARAPLAEIQC